MEEEEVVEDMAVEDVRKHNQLIDSIVALDGKKNTRQPQRSVFSNQISEFSFTGSEDKNNKVKLKDLLGSLPNKGVQVSLRKQINKLRGRQAVRVPAPKHEREKIQRKVAYEKTSSEVAKWDPVVERNRLADQIVYPLAETSIKVLTTDQLVQTFKPRTPLELEVAALLGQSDNVIKDKEDELTPAEKKALEAMDIEEARERRREMMKHRALLSYQQAKDARQKKIKSKSYHRVLKKEKRRKEEKILAEMEKNDPEGFAEKMKLLDRQRVKERMTLKHRGVSKFGQRQKLYAKYDTKAREQVQNMLQLSRDLTKKQEVVLDEGEEADSEGGVSLDSDDEDNTQDSEAISMDGKNPWMSQHKLRIKQKKSVSFSTPAEISKHMVKETNLTENKERVDERHLDEDKGNDGNTKEDYDFSRENKEEDDDFSKENAKEDDDFSIENTEEEDNFIEENMSENDYFSEENTNEEGYFCDQNRKKEKKIEIMSKKNIDDIEEIFKNFVPGVAKNSKSKTGKNKKKNQINTDSEKKEKKVKDSDRSRRESNAKIGNGDKTVKGNKILQKEGIDEGISETLNRKRTLEDFSDESETEISPLKKAREDNKKVDKSDSSDKKQETREAYVDPKKLMIIESKIQHTGKGLTIIEDDDDDAVDEEDQREMIAEAFADDDVIEEFMQEKEDIIEKKTVKDVDLTLPGWGDWGGEGVKPVKKKRLIVKAPEQKQRKDHYIGHVIINEDKLKDVAVHQVEHIPFPHTSVKQYEASIRVPIGETWNTPKAFSELAKPKVVTKMGAIISPIDKSETFQNEEKNIKAEGKGGKERKGGNPRKGGEAHNEGNSHEKGNAYEKSSAHKRFSVYKERKK